MLSKNGKYETEYFVVTAILDDNYILLANGKTRKLVNPKKKKVIHITFCSHNKILEQKFKNNAYILDSDIRKALSNYKIST